MKRLCVGIILVSFWHFVSAQNTLSWKDSYDALGLREELSDAQWEMLEESLDALAEHPLDINRCSREDLSSLPFLSAGQVMDVMEYRNRVGRLESPMELRMIPSLSHREIELLLHFVYIGEESRRDTIPRLATIWRYGKQELTGMVNIPFYSRKGDKQGYLGAPYKHWWRYVFAYGNRLRVGAVAAQDAGEPFFAGHNKWGWDYYSFYLQMRDWGHVKALALGRYRLKLGMGLVMNTSFNLGKRYSIARSATIDSRIYGHGGKMEANYLQGGAVDVCLCKGLDMMLFVSRRKVDATLTPDSDGVRTIVKTGYHRTHSEMSHRHNTTMQTEGFHIQYFKQGWHLGGSGCYTSLNRPLRPDKSVLYRRWYPEGQRFWNVSVDYGYLSHRLNVSGETAWSSHHAMATINMVSYMMSSACTLTLLHRFYPYQYQSLYGMSMSEGSTVNNESGLYIGATWHPTYHLNIMMYTDISYFPWPKYGVSAQSHRWDNYVEAVFDRGAWELAMRYRYKIGERNNKNGTAVMRRHEHRGRLSLSYSQPHWSVKTQADVSHVSFVQRQWGCMLSQYGAAQLGKMNVRLMAGYFHTAGYDTRIYVYEPGLLYDFSFPAYQGHGFHIATMIRTDVNRHLTVIGKVTLTKYFDRSKIGTGLRQIARDNMSNLSIQCRWRF